MEPMPCSVDQTQYTIHFSGIVSIDAHSTEEAIEAIADLLSKNAGVEQVNVLQIYPAHQQPLLDRRKAILAQSELSPSDYTELHEIETQVGSLPGGTVNQIRAKDIIQKAATVLLGNETSLP